MRRLVPLLLAALVTFASVPAHAGGASHHGKSPELQGYCPVCYLDAGKAVKGDPRYSGVYHGHRYVFASAEAKKSFEAARAKYQVACDGSCAVAASMGMKKKADPALFSVHEGRLYLFSGPDAKQMFDASPDELAKRADARWPEVARK